MLKATIFLEFNPCIGALHLPPPPGNPASFTLLALPNPIIRTFSWNPAPISLSAYLPWLPIDRSALPNTPLFMPFFIPKSSTVSSSPSSMPVTLARSLFSSYAFTFSIIDVGMFFMAVWVSPLMNSFPSKRIFFTSFPFMVIFPSSSTCAPGSFLTSSSTTEPSGVRYAEALYTKVSSLSVTLAACPRIVAPFSITASAPKLIFPMSTSGWV